MNKQEFISEFARHIIRSDTSLFLGAGSSCSVGFPNWSKLLEECSEKLKLKGKNETNLFAVAQYYSNKYGRSELTKIVKSVFYDFKYESELLNSIMDLSFKNIWTTNYDQIIEKNLAAKKITSTSIIRDIDLTSIDPKVEVNIYKLNGDLSDLDNIVITTSDIEQYSAKHELLLTFFKKELITNTFLFLGYSFTDSIVLPCLSLVSNCFNNASGYHYTIIEKSRRSDFEPFIEDLERRYHIKTLIVKSNNDIPEILSELKKKIESYRIFISGSFIKLNSDQDKFANCLTKKLTEKILEKYQIISGMGYKLGNYISGYGLNYLSEKHISNIEHHLIMRPFAEHMQDDQIQNHRENLISRCRFVIFLFGDSRKRSDGHNSLGVWQEYQTAKKLNKIIIPVGSTGYETRNIYNDICKNKTNFPYLERYLDTLGTSENVDKIVDVIMKIISDVNVRG